ncbi:MAG: DNA (cytosine-5-)-methyltransferase [Planctomycetota bacterium]|nr:DNA (cytosine-5-)-methyltransferase [Planctomycetota bacterium]
MTAPPRKLQTVGLFAGIGGIEAGLARHGHQAILLSEIDPIASVVLRGRFAQSKIIGDVRDLKCLPDCDLVAAGFPCQDLSQCGKTQGITGHRSSLVKEVFRLVESAKNRPSWLMLENVPFMLQLDSGSAMEFITSEVTRLGYRWAYRTVNALSFGLPQRRMRVVFIASRDADPSEVLFADNAAERSAAENPKGYGFYWTEGSKGLGWAIDSVPTLKGGSAVGIPSPPALWIPADRQIVTIDIRDAERLQGFRADWTKLPDEKRGGRWKLVGNAVCVKVAAWIGKRLARPGTVVCKKGKQLVKGKSWPLSACVEGTTAWEVLASNSPLIANSPSIVEFLRFPTRPLSARATYGFLHRAVNSRLRFEEQFLEDVQHHLETVATGQHERFRKILFEGVA